MLILLSSLVNAETVGFLTLRGWTQLSLRQQYMYVQGVFEGMGLIMIADILEGRRKRGEQLDYDLRLLTPLSMLDLINRYATMNPNNVNKYPLDILNDWKSGGFSGGKQ